MSGLTEEEQIFLKQIEERKIKHKEAQKKYRQSNKDKVAEYNKTYNENQKSKMNEIKSKLPPRQPQQPTKINIQEITQEPQKTNKKATTDDIKPFYEKRKEPLTTSTIDAYISKADILQRFFIKKSLSQELKAELINLFNNNDFDEDLILSQMTYINNDIEPTIQALRTHYKNDNTFKNYINILVVITSHLKTFNKSIYQTLTKINIFLNNEIQEKRKDNEIEEADKDKIIDLDKSAIITNINKLSNIDDKLIYALYSLFPARRLEWRLTKIILDETTNINDVKYNYLILKDGIYQIIFNNYKTATTYGRQIFNIDNDELTNILNDYIIKSKLLNGDFLFSLKTNKKKEISQSNFSSLISNVFFKVYNIHITIRFLRISHITYILNKNPTIKEMEILAYKMGHGLEEQGKYKKILK
jgi:hypothetical protein